MALDAAFKAAAGTKSWRERVKPALQATGHRIAAALAAPANAAKLSATLIKETDGHVCCRLAVADRSGFYKQFDSATGAIGYRKERDSLLALRRTRIAPRILAYSDTHQWVLTEDAGPQPPPEDPEAFARRAGAWAAALEAVAPFEPAADNWLSYFDKLGLGQILERIPGASRTLSAIPLCGRVLSRNDSALHNFLYHRSGRLIACDFESAAMRPRGWEYVSLRAALLQRHAENAGQVLQACSDGFAGAHRGGLMVGELDTVARLLTCARVAQNGMDVTQ